jgi:DNA-binding MarR family transcriptional regulator
MSELQTVLYDRFLAFNRKLLRITRRLSPPLSLAESHVLGEIRQLKIAHFTLLIRNLSIEKTKVSRTLSRFIERKWVTEEVSGSDRRVHFIQITPEGLNVFNRDSQVRNRQVLECLVPLSQAERRALAHILDRMANNLNAAPVNPLPGDPIGKVEIRRLTRALGYISDNLMGIGKPVDECQLIHLTWGAGGSMPLSELKELLPYETTGVSRLTTALARQGFITKEISSRDRRQIKIRLTKSGVKQAQKNVMTGGTVLKDALGALGDDQLAGFIQRLTLFTAEDDAHARPPPSDSIVIRRLSDPKALALGRTFIASHLVEQKRTDELRAMLLHPKNIIFELTQFEELRGICEISVDDNGAEIQYFLVTPELIDSNAAEALLVSTLKATHEVAPKISLTIDPSLPLPDRILKILSAVHSAWTVEQLLSRLSHADDAISYRS